MPLIIPDEALEAAGMTEEEARLEIACRLFEIGRLALWSAAKLAQVSRVEIEEALLERGIPLYRPTPDDLEAELDSFDRLGV